jgi:hypothetical protein
MFKGYNEIFKTKLEEYNKNSEFVLFCVYDLEPSPDRKKEENQFDILSSELREKLGNVITSNGGVMKPRGIRWPEGFPERLKSSSAFGFKNFYTWIKVKKTSLAEFANKSKGRIIDFPNTSDKTQINVLSATQIIGKSFLGIELEIGHEDRYIMNWVSNEYSKVSNARTKALNEIRTSLGKNNLADVQTAEIDWMDVLPDWCSCEVKETGNIENNALYSRHINSCLWRNKNEINTFKDKVIGAIKQGAKRFEDYKTEVIKHIVKHIEEKNVSESELETKFSNWEDWKTRFLNCKDKILVDKWWEKAKKNIDDLVILKNKTEKEEKEFEEEVKKKKERIVKEQKEQREKEEKEKELKGKRDKAIEEINTALNQEPKLTNFDLILRYQIWEEKINRMTEEAEINSYKDKVLTHIQSQRKNKKVAEEVNENLRKATNPNATIQDKKDALENLDKNEGEQALEDNKEETKQIKQEVAEDNPNEYRDKLIIDLDKKLTANGLKESDLDSETRQELKELKDKQDWKSDQLVETELKIVEKIGKKGAEKKMDNLTYQVETVKNEGKKEWLKEQLLEIIHSNNVYYLEHKDQAQILLKKLEASSSQNTSPSQKDRIKGMSPTTWIVVVIAIIAVFGLITLITHKNGKNKSRKSTL